ncbi:MAG TPA: M15 family metallopeptidase [Gaiellaceae bacterium]|nr:M15 family metallopeptidase [Gaiellaceae bacterium]
MKTLAAAASILVLAGLAGTASAAFHSTVHRIPPAVKERIVGSSWHKGCPVPLRKLRLVRATIHRFDGTDSRGRLIVHRGEAHDIAHVFHKLYRADYPIRRMRLVDAYGADDDRSMAANNTSAFNCRFVAGTSSWSMHAYGRAIDLNPVQNPYVSGSQVSPAKGKKYADRSLHKRGMIHAGDAVVRAFASIGWEWGGSWSGGTRDYQHFSSNGH